MRVVAEMAVVRKTPYPTCVLSLKERRQLERQARSRSLPLRLVIRSRIVLAWAEGWSARDTAAALEISETTVRLWRQRFVTGGLPALEHDAPGRGRKSAMSAEMQGLLKQVQAGADPRSLRGVARMLGVAPSTVSRWLQRVN